MTEPTVSVIVVTYNTRDMTLRCLRRLYETLGNVQAEVIVVDNSSSDGTAAAISSEFPNVQLIASGKNGGFGAGNNLGLKQACGRYLLLLNSDAFPESNAISRLIEYLDQHPEVGAAGPRLLNENRSLQLSCFPFPSPGRAWVENLWIARIVPRGWRFDDYRRWDHSNEKYVDWVIGACMIVRKEVYQAVGGFDEQFFMYFEETDWQRRIGAAGWKIGFTPKACVVHLGGASGADNAGINPSFFQSLDRYELKNHGWMGMAMVRAAMAVGSTLRLGAWTLAWLMRPARRTLASRKLRLHTWLIIRQTTLWSPGAPNVDRSPA